MGYTGIMSKSKVTFGDQIRRAVEDCGMTRYAIAKATGIDNATLSRFIHGQAWMSEATMNALAEFLGLEVVARKGTKGRQ